MLCFTPNEDEPIKRVAGLVLCVMLAGCSRFIAAEPQMSESDAPESGEPVFEESPSLSTVDPAAALPSPLCPDPQPPFVTDFEVRAPSALDEPPTRAPFRDPIFGVCLVRVTERSADLAPQDPSKGMKNEYARVDSFNADGSFILVRSLEAYWYLYDAASLRPLGRLPLEGEPRWDAVDPNLIYYTDETRLMAYSLASGSATVVRDFAADFPGQPLSAVWTRNEGRPSMDSGILGLLAQDGDWNPLAFVVYDRDNDQVSARDLRGVPGVEEGIDHVTISPRGDYFLASFDHYCEHGRLGDDAHPCGLMVYDRGLQKGRGVLRIIGHYDVALDASGREVVVFQDIDNDSISMLDLESGEVTPLFPIDFSHSPLGFHFSGLAYDQPGWALVSTYSGGYPQAYTWMDDQVFALELKPGGRVVRLAHTRSQVDPELEHDYWAEPHATVNRSFTRVLFTSNWGRSGSEEVEMYMIALPEEWVAMLP